MRCLFCGKRLALLRKLTDGEFCTAAHRQRYVEEEQKLALARLMEAEPRGGKSKIQPREASTPGGNSQVQEVAGFRKVDLIAKSKAFSPATWPQPLASPSEACLIERSGRGMASTRALHTLENTLVSYQPRILAAPLRSAPDISECPLAPVFQPREVMRTVSLGVSAPRPSELVQPVLNAPKDSASVAHRRPRVSVFLKLARPDPPASGELRCTQPNPGSGLLPESLETVGATTPGAISSAAPLSFERIPAKIRPTTQELCTTGMPVEAAHGEDLIEASGRLAPAIRWWPFALFRAGASNPRESPLKEGVAATPQCSAQAPLRPNREAVVRGPSLSGARLARSEQVASDCEREIRTAPQDECFGIPAELPLSSVLPAPAAVLRSESEAPTESLSPAAMEKAMRGATPDAIPSLPTTQVPAGLTPLGSVTIPFPPAEEVRLPEPVPGIAGEPLAAVTAPLGFGSVESTWALAPPPFQPLAPAAAEALLALKWSLEPRRQPVRAQDSAANPVDPSSEPIVPKLRLETVLHAENGGEKPDSPGRNRSTRKARAWMAASGFWHTAPADLKWLSLALPAVLLVVLVSAIGSRSTKPVQSVRANEATRSSYLQNAVREKWGAVRRNIASRAAISLQDDFRSGLAEWEGPGNWAKDWQYDPAGFVLTGPLAMYRPSLDLTDYRFEFLGQIDKKSLNWVFRAADYKNYYAMKIVLLKSGPLPKATIVRYAVVNGKQDRTVQLALPMEVRNDTFFRVRMEVRGQNFTTSVQDQVVDFWSDGRLSRGGVGFFSDKGERARLRWVEVSHQHDTLGRLCAFFAPYNIQSGNGSLNRQ